MAELSYADITKLIRHLPREDIDKIDEFIEEIAEDAYGNGYEAGYEAGQENAWTHGYEPDSEYDALI